LVKLVKAGHEHGEVSYGFDERVRKMLFGSIVPLSVFLSTNGAQATKFLNAAMKLAVQDWRFAGMLVLFMSLAVYYTYGLIFWSTNAKRRKRRYLLALNTIHETWSDVATDLAVSEEAASVRQRCTQGLPLIVVRGTAPRASDM
jgi:hypothetical protein